MSRCLVHSGVEKLNTRNGQQFEEIAGVFPIIADPSLFLHFPKPLDRPCTALPGRIRLSGSGVEQHPSGEIEGLVLTINRLQLVHRLPIFGTLHRTVGQLLGIREPQQLIVYLNIAVEIGILPTDGVVDQI